MARQPEKADGGRRESNPTVAVARQILHYFFGRIVDAGFVQIGSNCFAISDAECGVHCTKLYDILFAVVS